jgi:acetolactate synthase-1/2/3 large subunit
MKIKISDYIAEFLVENGIKDIFTVTGGGAMHLNDSFGHHPKINCTYNHHEQASAIAAEAYARVNNKIAPVCVTSGPGATNAITGCLCGYMSSLPMLIISGQVRYATTARSTGLFLRTMGIQEYDIIRSVEGMTKYCEMIVEPNKIRYCLEKALYLAYNGRPGPTWLDIPLDIQSSVIETDTLLKYDENKDISKKTSILNDETIEFILDKIQNATRPVIIVGSGVRLSGGYEIFLKLIERLNIPVVTTMSSIDSIATDHPLYAGRNGNTGDRPGNFAIQNSDLILSLGGRLSFMETGFNYKTWARQAYKIINDIDKFELMKPNIEADLSICCNVKILMEKLLHKINEQKLFNHKNWLDQCQLWKLKYPVVLEKHYDDKNANIYVLFKELTNATEADATLVVSVGTSRVAGSQASIIKDGQRFITNPATAPMGYGLPAAIGVSIANNKRKVICVTGDGSLQMNIQELQTIIHNKLPIIIFVINNNGYQSIRQTQKNYFKEPLIGVGSDSGDISFPDISKIAEAYGFKYFNLNTNEKIEASIKTIINLNEPLICEVIVSTEQVIEPKVSSKRLEDGRMISAPLEDMAPFLPREEIRNNMFIPLVAKE